MKASTILQKKVLWTISLGEMLLWLLFCAFFATLFYSVLIYSGYIFVYKDGKEHIIPGLAAEILAEYTNKALLTLPLWYIYFIALKGQKIWQTLLLHLLTMPLFVFAWATLDRFWIEMMGLIVVLDRSAAWFDIFFPMVFYLIQFGIFHTYNYWLDTQKQNKRERELIELAHQSELKSLRAQIQPHFLFNTLNSISASMPAEQETTRELIAKLAYTFRYALKAAEQEWIPLQEEVGFVTTLLQLEQARFGDRLEYEIKGNYKDYQVDIPPMLLQPIVENAVKHGIAPSITGGKVSIDLHESEGMMHISVSNTGMDYKGSIESLHSSTNGVGLKNTRQRLELLYGEKMQIYKNKEEGLIFSFKIPIGARI